VATATPAPTTASSASKPPRSSGSTKTILLPTPETARQLQLAAQVRVLVMPLTVTPALITPFCEHHYCFDA
jgi:hypothetical protein